VCELSNKTHSDKGNHCSPWAFIALDYNDHVLFAIFTEYIKITYVSEAIYVGVSVGSVIKTTESGKLGNLLNLSTTIEA
jgi:hypothetical protein